MMSACSGVCHDRAVTRVPRQRLDQLLVERGLAPTRSRAQALVLAGHVRVGLGDGGRTDRKPGDLLPTDSPVELVAQERYVSRGGHKLEAALEAFDISPADRVCVDVGASTGGFTDVLLQRGARRVYAVDVGYGQLHYRLRNDPRVVSLERTNIRFLTELPEPADLGVVDVSFISLKLALPPMFKLVKAEIVALIKPQFEAGREHVGKGGVVRDASVRKQVINDLQVWSTSQPWTLQDTVESPIKGPAGNVEY